MFVNNLASPCNKDNEQPFTYVDPWDAYPTHPLVPPTATDEAQPTAVLKPHENVPQILVIVEPPTQNVLPPNEDHSFLGGHDSRMEYPPQNTDPLRQQMAPPPTSPQTPAPPEEHCHSPRKEPISTSAKLRTNKPTDRTPTKTEEPSTTTTKDSGSAQEAAGAEVRTPKRSMWSGIIGEGAQACEFSQWGNVLPSNHHLPGTSSCPSSTS